MKGPLFPKVETGRKKYTWEVFPNNTIFLELLPKLKTANFFKEVEVADVEKVKSAGNINNLLARLRAFAVGKLEGD